MRALFVCSIALLFGSTAHAQSLPSLQPPGQAYVYEFTSTTSAAAPLSPALNLGASFSVEFWMMLSPYALPHQTNVPVFHKNIPNSGDPFFAYSLSLNPTNQLGYFQGTGNPGSDRGVSQFGPALTPGQWYHVAVVSNNLAVTLYLNGTQQAQFLAVGPPPINSLPLTLGGAGGAFLRQVRIWGRALSASEITSFATTLLTGSESGLIADWPLDDGQGVAPRDVGPNGLPLQLLNGYPLQSFLFPIWARTEIADGGPYYQVSRLTVPPTTISQTAVYTIPIDFDSDGNVDLLECQTAKSPALPCAAFRNDGKGNFGDVTLQVLGPNPPAFETARDYRVADFNGDGRADVFIANTGECSAGCGNTGGQSALLMQTPDGRLQDATAAAGLPQQPMFTHNVACADIDGNGTVDIYLANQNTVAHIGQPQIWLNDGHGHFTLGDPSRLPAILSGGAYNTGKFIDVNNDGRLDLFVGSDDAKRISHMICYCSTMVTGFSRRHRVTLCL